MTCVCGKETVIGIYDNAHNPIGKTCITCLYRRLMTLFGREYNLTRIKEVSIPNNILTERKECRCMWGRPSNRETLHLKIKICISKYSYNICSECIHKFVCLQDPGVFATVYITN